jgi:hypothetical protein
MSLAENELAKMEIQELYTTEDFRACAEIRARMQERHEKKMEELCPQLEACAARILRSAHGNNILEHARPGAFEGSIAGIVMSRVKQTYPEQVVMEEPLESLRWLRQSREQRLAQASGR